MTNIWWSRYEQVVSENGPFLSSVKHFGGGEARLCSARINSGGSYVVRMVGGLVDISHLAPFQARLAETFRTRSGVKSLGTIVVGEADRLHHGVSVWFELAARSHRNLGGETLLCMFHEGLKPTIKSKLDVAEFESLQALMDRAMIIEARNLAWWEEGGSQWGKQHEADPKSSEGFNRGTNWARHNNFHSYFECSPPPEPKDENQVTHTTQFPAFSSWDPKHNSSWISNEEWLEHQHKGLCYKCGMKWNPSHTCWHRHQHLVLVDADKEEELEPSP